LLHRCSERLSTLWQKLRRRLRQRRKPQSLRVYDVTSLGDKRFVAVVQYGRKRFLVGGGAGSVSLLSKLDREDLPEPLHAGRAVRSNVPPVPLISAADDASPFNVKIAEATAGARLAI
jgi:flagellar biogenesis protein FliO